MFHLILFSALVSKSVQTFRLGISLFLTVKNKGKLGKKRKLPILKIKEYLYYGNL
jgi:hypothetical protein